MSYHESYTYVHNGKDNSEDKKEQQRLMLRGFIFFNSEKRQRSSTFAPFFIPRLITPTKG
jgi:hypothetical protein